MLGQVLVQHLAHLFFFFILEKLTREGAISGMIAGALVVIIWIVWVKPLANINELFGMYEIIPGFISSVIVTYLVSIFTYKSDYSIEQQLNQVKTIVREK